MKFMMIVKATKESEAGVLPTVEEFAEMGKLNKEMEKAGILIDLSGLQASSKGARVNFQGGKKAVVDGPFAETKELIAGYWIVDVPSKQDAVDWALKVPFVDGQVEIRQVFELSDFPNLAEDVKKLETRLSAKR